MKIDIHIASFENEHYISAEINNEINDGNKCNAKEQKDALDAAIMRASADMSLMWKRYFVSDIFNQKHLFDYDVFSVVQQPPLSGSKISVLAYFISKRSNYTHVFSGRMFSLESGAFEQTKNIFENYIAQLEQQGMSLANNTIRTWIYVQDVDNRYGDMVSARNEIFARAGLTEHSIASTGIEGRGGHHGSFVLMDAYAANVTPEQITYLKAETHLSPTSEYGVSFERATAVDYADRRHIFISGTASIDSKGDIVAECNIEKQLSRTMENISALLSEGNACTGDIVHFIIYLRDSGDHSFVKDYFDTHYPDTPRVIVRAPVCRPGWLIEIECIAIAKQTQQNTAWLPF
jgi:enamine deaminase RidA (YjgF/YER057c/UK114 family)